MIKGTFDQLLKEPDNLFKILNVIEQKNIRYENLFREIEWKCRKFIDKVNNGQARSKETYRDFTEIVDKIKEIKQ